MLHGILRLEGHPSMMIGFFRNIEGIGPLIREPIRAIQASNSTFVPVLWRWKLMNQVVSEQDELPLSVRLEFRARLDGSRIFFGVMVMKLTPGRLVNGLYCDGIDMVIKNLNSEPKDIIVEFYSPSKWKELSKESDFYMKFYSSLGRAPNRCSISIGKAQGFLSFTRGIGKIEINAGAFFPYCHGQGQDFNTKFYNSPGRAPNRCSSSIGKTRGVVIVHSRNRLRRLDQGLTEF
nr:hypothetical protein [Tanacetum cinerariifolium]